MATKPTSNSPAEMQKWSRWVDKQLDELGDAAIPAIKAQLERMNANDIRYQQELSNLQYQIKYLSDAITADTTTDFAALQTFLGRGQAIQTITPPPAEPETPETSKTVIFTASGSASWAGSALITGTGEFTDAKMMYQGPAAGSQKTASFWFSAANLATVAGKTITSASIYVRNRHFYYSSGGTVNFGTHANQSAVRPTVQTNAFNVAFNYGEGKYVSLSSTVYNGISSGSVKGFSIGIGATDDPNDYAYFDGALKDSPPKLKITYNL
jgi:hypothetical protein